MPLPPSGLGLLAAVTRCIGSKLPVGRILLIVKRLFNGLKQLAALYTLPDLIPPTKPGAIHFLLRVNQSDRRQSMLYVRILGNKLVNTCKSFETICVG